MVLWGAIWGGVLGILWPDFGLEWEWSMLAGAALGALAGRTLRGSVRKEIKAQFEALGATQPIPRATDGLPATATTSAASSSTAPSSNPPSTTSRPAAASKLGPLESLDDEWPLDSGASASRISPPVDFSDTTPAALASGETSAAATSPGQPSRATAPAPSTQIPPRPPQPNVIETLFGKARDWLFGGNTVVRMGVLVLFVGLAFLAKYAMDNALLPPELRLAAIGIAGIALLVVGFRLRNAGADKRGYALTLQGAGVGVLYLTVFAAFRLYQFLPPNAAFVALGLICLFAAVIALAQNALPMAFIGFAGGFAAPILVSTGQGNYVALFSYYLLLGVAIAAIAWARAWRPLNLLGFFATFGVATAWGVLSYKPEQFATTEPFLIAFFIVYLAATILYALRHSLSAKKAVDATLVFGLPIVTMCLQAALVRHIEYAMAFSSLALGALYLALGWWLARRKSGQHETSRWLAESFAALGLGFVTLAVPLALDAGWTSAVWAIEGAGVYWMGRRQGRWLARAAGLALQVFAAVAYLDAIDYAPDTLLAFANPTFIGAIMLAGAALALAWWSRDPLAPTPGQNLGNGFVKLENSLSPLLFWAGFLWLQFALTTEINRAPLNDEGYAAHVLAKGLRFHLQLLSWVGVAFVFHHLALPKRSKPWAIAATPAWTVLPALMVGAFMGAIELNHVFVWFGWIFWPVMLLLHAVMLRRLDSGAPARWWSWVHAGGVWLLVLLIGNALVFAIGRADLWQTAWATVILLVSGTLVLLLLSRRRWYGAAPGGWPMDRFARSYLWLAAAPLALAVAFCALLIALLSDGNADPLPYVPVLNPTDLSVALALGACALWLLRLRGAAFPLPASAVSKRWQLGLAAIVFIAINTVWLRVAHHYGGVPWDSEVLFDSFLVQAGYSILWTSMALVLMVVAFRRGWRGTWMLGAGLLGLTVLKLFVIDLSNRGGSERIIVFIAVGLLMLVVGYFAPIPPAAKTAPSGALKEDT